MKNTKKATKKATKTPSTQTPRATAKVKKVMHEYKEGELHSGSKKGPKVKSRTQAIAIALSEAGMSRTKGAKKGSSKSGSTKKAAKRGSKKSSKKSRRT